ncbi:MAG: ankyrin repeat domain-containing protein [Planctomycetaceae bacterium]|nr:ankyrin repeat domain-containing protein [Planctomycetaceae bacterium]
MSFYVHSFSVRFNEPPRRLRRKEAAKNGTVNDVRYLINNGADVNAKGYDGKTALDIAVNEGQSEVAKYLRSVGAK